MDPRHIEILSKRLPEIATAALAVSLVGLVFSDHLRPELLAAVEGFRLVGGAIACMDVGLSLAWNRDPGYKVILGNDASLSRPVRIASLVLLGTNYLLKTFIIQG